MYGFHITGANVGLDIAPQVEIALDLEFQRIAGSNKIFQYSINHMFMENLHVTERVDVEFERFQLNAAVIGNITNVQCREIRKIGKGTDCREFRCGEIDLDSPARVFIRKGVERVKVHLFPRCRTNLETGFWCYLTQRWKFFV